MKEKIQMLLVIVHSQQLLFWHLADENYVFWRLREEGATGKLAVECTGEGILFSEADADVTLDQFGYPLVPPFSCLDQLLYEEPASSDILNCPLVLIQVTRLKCGGFIFGFLFNHAMCDGDGISQFLSAIGEMARGAASPFVLPVWERHVLNSTNQSLLEQNHDIYDSINDVNLTLEQHDPCYKTFIFGPNETAALRRCLPLHLRHCSSFELITTAIWKCRVAALQPHHTEEVSLIWAINLRGKLNHFIPAGYYGNAVGFSISTSTAKEILENPLCYTLQLLRNAKVTKDYDGSVVKLMTSTRSFTVTDVRYAGLEEVDYGWGKALYAGLATCVPLFAWYQMQFDRKKGEMNGIMFPICLPKQAMERFEMEINSLLKDQKQPSKL